MLDERNRSFREMKSYRFLEINEKSFFFFLQIFRKILINDSFLRERTIFNLLQTFSLNAFFKYKIGENMFLCRFIMQTKGTYFSFIPHSPLKPTFF